MISHDKQLTRRHALFGSAAAAHSAKAEATRMPRKRTRAKALIIDRSVISFSETAGRERNGKETSFVKKRCAALAWKHGGLAGTGAGGAAPNSTALDVTGRRASRRLNETIVAAHEHG